jgi:Tol biopolymer transport system component
VSPDGRWAAFLDSKTGKSEVYVAPFPRADTRWKISTGGGAEPRWRADGRELFYLAPDGRLMAVPVRTTGRFEAGQPVSLFTCRVEVSSTAQFGPAGRNQYDVTPDGERFIVSEVSGESPITVVVNWPALLKR